MGEDDHLLKRKEVEIVQPSTDNNWILNNLNFSRDQERINWVLLKNTINRIILLGIQLNRPKHEIETIIEAGDLIDNIRDEIELRNYFHPHENILNQQDIVPGV